MHKKQVLFFRNMHETCFAERGYKKVHLSAKFPAAYQLKESRL